MSFFLLGYLRLAIFGDGFEQPCLFLDANRFPGDQLKVSDVSGVKQKSCEVMPDSGKRSRRFCSEY